MVKANRTAIKILIGTLLALGVGRVLAAAESLQTEATAANDFSSVPSPAPPSVLPSKDPPNKVLDMGPLVLVSKEVATETFQEPLKATDLPQEEMTERAQQVIESIPSLHVSKESKKKEEPKDKAHTLTKTLSGEISASNSQGVAVIYERNEKKGYENEFWLPFAEDLELKGYQTIKDLRPGDRVEVKYEETETGSNRAVKKITLREKAAEPQKVVENKQEQNEQEQ